MREYHQPLEFVERPVPEPVHATRRAHPDRRRGRLRDRSARDRGPDGARRSHAPARARPRERGLGRGGRRGRHDGRQGRRGARLPAAQLRPLRALPARRRHALRPPPVHRPDRRRRLRRLRARARALAPGAAGRRRAGGRRAPRRRRAHGVPRRPAARAPRDSRHDRRRDRRRRRRPHRAAAPARARRRARRSRSTPTPGAARWPPSSAPTTCSTAAARSTPCAS